MSARKPSDTARVEDWAWLDALVGPLDEDFVQALNEKPAPQERPSLDFFDRSDLSKPPKSD
jgi:hypothetical protein